MYSLIKKCLFALPPETAHHLTLQSLKCADRLKLLEFFLKNPSHPLTIMGLSFQNPIGLAAGLDKNADYVDALSHLGFGFIEVGTVTPKPQYGNPKPRLFRLIKEEALLNRMGFNSKGALYVAKQLKKMRYRGILGINIGKNKETPLENAVDDYLFCFHQLCSFASYITINISSPNTKNLRDLQASDALIPLLSALKKAQKKYAEEKKYVPLVVKISPDLSDEALFELAEILLQQKIDGVIATNTTVNRNGIESLYAKEEGGLSGKPLEKKSTEIIKKLHTILQDKIPIIASGGVMDEQSAQEKLEAGATLLQIYTGFIYQGPGFIQRLVKAYIHSASI